MRAGGRAALALVIVVAGTAGRARAQLPQNERLVTADGVRLDFPPDGVWRRRARRVAQRRALLRARSRQGVLSAPASSQAALLGGTAVAGDLGVPTVLVGFADTDFGQLAPREQYDSIFYTTQPLAGRPYTQRTFYEELSNDLLHVVGTVYGWYSGTNPRTYYLDACGTSANALDCATGRLRMRQLFTTALAAMDGSVDFGRYDNDGPDGLPNSGDDDGVVDVVQFVQPVVGGECGGRGIWAHKFTLQGIGGAFITNDVTPGGASIKVGPYHIVGGVGGESCTDATQIMGIGTASHELGHGFGLPDLYDVSGQTQGVGEWGLMGSANYRSLLSPGHLGAWSKEQLGWVTVRELAATGVYSLGPVVSRDTVLMIRPRGANPRGEYFLLENKQALGSDVYNMTVGSSRAGAKHGGLLVWHVDSLKLAAAWSANAVNSGTPQAVALVQADGLDQLEKPSSAGGNRGDAGDPYPGSSGNPALSHGTTPEPLRNADSSFAGFGLTGITQDVPNGAMSLGFAFATVIRASDTLALISVDGIPYHRYDDVLNLDGPVTVSVDSVQTSADGRARHVFLSWSDGGQRTHGISALTVADSLVAAVDASYRLTVTQMGVGAIEASPAVDLAGGTFFPAGTAVTLVAQSGADSVFDGWSGDTTIARDTLVLIMRRPYTLAARFVGRLAVVPEPVPVAIMGASFGYALPLSGGTGSYDVSLAGGVLPPGLYLYSDGRFAGIASETGTFDVTLRVASGSQIITAPLQLRVDAPVVALDVVINQLLDLDARLTEDQVRYFDLLGNRNAKFDLGDFLAFVKKTGVKPPAEVMARVMARERS